MKNNPLREAELLLSSSPMQRADPMWYAVLVLITYLPMFSGDANLIYREYPDIVKLLRDTQNHHQFRGIVRLIGLSEVTRLVQLCLANHMFTSKASICANVPKYVLLPVLHNMPRY